MEKELRPAPKSESVASDAAKSETLNSLTPPSFQLMSSNVVQREEAPEAKDTKLGDTPKPDLAIKTPPATTTGPKDSKVPAPAEEPGEAVPGDTEEYYVSATDAVIRDNKNPKKIMSWRLLPAGLKVKRLRELDSSSQVEVIGNHGNKGFPIGSKYWTSTINLSSSELATEKELFWLPKGGTVTEGPWNSGKASKLPNETFCNKEERIKGSKGNYVLLSNKDQTKTLGWINESDVLKAPKDLAADFHWMEDVTWESKLPNASDKDFERIKANRSGVNDRTNKGTYKDTLFKYSKTGYAYSDKSKDVEVDIVGDEGIEKKVNTIIYNTISREGSFSAVNTWDGQIFSWGKGWASNGGGLPKLMLELFKINPDYIDIFRNVGIDVEAGYFRILDDTGKLLADDPKATKDKYLASEYIRKSTQIQSFFIEFGEKEAYRKDLAKANYNLMLKGAGKLPSYVIDKKGDKYADGWNESSVKTLAYLSHWLSAGSWASVDYSSTKGIQQLILDKYINKVFPAVSQQCDERSRLWKEGFTLVSKLKDFGSPKGDAFEHYIKNWPSDLLVDIEARKFTMPGSKKEVLLACIKGTDLYLEGVNLVPEGGGRYRAILPLGETDLEPYKKGILQLGLSKALGTIMKF